MNKIIHIAFPTVAMSAVLLLGAVVAEASHSWGGYHWARTTPSFTLKLGDDVGSAWKAYLTLASSDWSVSSVLDTTIVPGGNIARPSRCRPVNGRVEVCNATYGNNGWLGVAQIWISGTHITQGTVKMNDTYFNTSTYNKPSWRQFVMCQEIGHTFGLDHQNEAFDNPNLGTCMDYTNDPARDDGAGDNLHPNAHDYDELVLIYGHLDPFTTISASKNTLPASVNADSEEPDAWGREVRRSRDGRTSLLERDLDRGQKVFTFVVWADSTAK